MTQISPVALPPRPPHVIAEIGCNHMGRMELARELIMVAASFCKVDVAKFQKRTVKELLSPEQYAAPHPNPGNSYGATYGAHREALEFDVAQHYQLKTWCEQFGTVYSTSVWDLTAAKQIATLAPALLKIPSASNLDWAMLGWLCGHFGGEIHISFGMTTRAEEKAIVDFVEGKGRAGHTVLYACTSGYPVAFDDLCLLEIQRLQHAFGHRVKGIGFSGHHLGIAADVAAMTLGARWIERHFTLDRTWKGTDHSASLEPDGMRRLVRDLAAIDRALTVKSADLLEVEKPQRAKLKTHLPH